MRRRFLWTRSLDHKGFTNLVKWEEVCKPKYCGGLGIINLRIMNKALLGKWIWKWFDGKPNLWKQISFYKYFEKNGPSTFTLEEFVYLIFGGIFLLMWKAFYAVLKWRLEKEIKLYFGLING